MAMIMKNIWHKVKMIPEIFRNELKLTTNLNPDNTQQDSKLLIRTSSANTHDSKELICVVISTVGVLALAAGQE
jgi:hypothetical protein